MRRFSPDERDVTKMQRIDTTQKPMRVPDRGCAVRRRMELQRSVILAGIATIAALLVISAIVTGMRQANAPVQQNALPANVLVVETK